MAFGKKYFSSYKSNNNLDYYLEIFLEDYTGSALELVMGAGGPVIEYETDQEDRFSPIISSSCKIPYLVENFLDSTFIDDLRNNYQERQVYVHIYRSTQSGSSGVAPLWSGFLIMDIGSGVDKYFPYEEHLKFVDGLSLLKDIDFVDLGVTGGTPPFEERVQGNYALENMYFGPRTYIYWIREILAKSGAALTNQGASQNYGFTTSVNWYNGEMNATGQSSDPLHKTKCAVSMFHRKDDQGVFYPDNCYNVLKELLRHWGARITYWKHEFWIVQIPEYITSETGTISTPVNNNSRLYSNTGAYQGSQNHLGSTFYTRYEQTIENDKISKLSGTKYDYLPIIKQVNADFLSFSSKSYFGGFPFGTTAPTQEVFQGTINSPSAADFLYLSIPLNWTWDLTNAPNFPNGHTNGWWCSIKFNFYASDGTTTYYLQYDSSGQGSYYWVDSALWTPLGNRSPKYIISSKLADVTGHIGFEQQIPFEDENGNAISMSGAWSFFLDIEDYGTGNSNPGSFYCNFSPSTMLARMRNPGTAIQVPPSSGVMSGTVSWSNTLADQQGQVTISTINNPAGFNAGTVNPDIRFATTSPFLGLLQTLNNTQSASFGETFNVINSNTQAKQNSEQFDFGTLLWGDSLEFAPSSLQVFDGSNYVNTEPSGEWGRGILTGTKTFTKMLIDEFFTGQTKIIISPSMRLAVGVANKNEDQSGTLRPRYVNPIGKLRETRDGTDPEYFFRRGSFYTLLDEWDYEGYQIIRNVPTTTTQSNGMGSMGGSQSGSPAPSGMSPSPMVQALSQNSPLAYIRATIPATGSNVAVNGNFNTAVGWTLGSGWSIDTTAKKAKFAATGSTSELTQSVLTQGLTYQVNFQVEVTAGTLLVKAGTSGTSQSITSSGDYSIYLDCEGSSLIKFQAGTTFTGNITYITLRDQKSLSSVPIEAIGTAVFKTGDTFNLINSNDDTILPLTVTSNQGSGDTTISVSSTPLYEDIDNGSYLLINQDDLSEQYQNKTKGTVAGFDITATGIAKSSINITDWLNSDTMSGAAVTNVPTALSVKNYVDGQVGASDTLAEVLANGNVTGGTNISVNDDDKITFGESSDLQIYHDQSNSYIDEAGSGGLYIRANSFLTLQKYTGENMAQFFADSSVRLYYNNSKKLETTSTGIEITGGGVFTDQVTIPATPVASTDAASKSYVDAQVGSADTLQEVTDNGNTTTNNIMIGSSAVPDKTLVVSGVEAEVAINDSSNTPQIRFRNSGVTSAIIAIDSTKNMLFKTNGTSEKMRLTSGGNLGIGTTSPTNFGTGSVLITAKAQSGGGYGGFISSTDSVTGQLWSNQSESRVHLGARTNHPLILTVNNLEKARLSTNGNLLLGTTTDSGEKLVVNGNAKFADQVTIPATPVASTDAASKSYVDAQVGASDTLQEVTDNGNTTTNSIMIGSSSSPEEILHIQKTDNDARIQIITSNTRSSTIFFGDTDDRNAGIIEYDNNGDFMRFFANANEAMRISSSQNVLIGTTTDGGHKLEVFEAGDSLSIGDNTNSQTYARFANTRTMVGYGGANAVFQSGLGKGINFNVNNDSFNSGTAVTLTSGGNLLIGTTVDYGAKLVISGKDDSGGADLLSLQFDNSPVDTGLVFTDINGTVKNRITMESNDTSRLQISSIQDIRFYTNTITQPSSNLRMAISNNGNVGIGTSSPNEKLTISGANTNTLKITPSDSETTYFTTLTNNFSAGLGTELKAGIYNILTHGLGTGTAINFTNSALKFNFRDVEKARITDNGNLLLGTTTDSGAKLNVQGSLQVGVDDTGYNVTFYGDTSSRYMLWNASQDRLEFPDFTALYFGNSQDLLIRHDSTDSIIQNNGGDFYITQHTNAKDLKLQCDNGTGGVTPYITLDGSAGYTTVQKNIRFEDLVRAEFGNSGDLDIYHTGSYSVIDNATGHLYIENSADDHDIYLRCDDGSGGKTAYITLDGSQTTINLYKNVLIGTTTDNGGKLYVNSSTTDRVARFESSDSLAYLQLNDNQDSVYISTENQIGSFGGLTGSNSLNFNISLTSGNAALGGTPSAVYKLDVVGKARVQSVFELDDVLTLNAISTPADPASGKSSIYMDSADGAIKVKINVGGTVVTRTIASFE